MDAVTYQWFPVQGLSNPTIPNPIASPDTTTTYIVDFTNGCGTLQDSITIDVHKVLFTRSPDVSICPGDSIQVWATGGVSYLWEPSIYVLEADRDTTVAFPPEDQVFSVLITDTLNCSTTGLVEVTLYDSPALDAGHNLVIWLGEEVRLNPSGTGTFVWTLNDSMSCTACVNPIVNPTEDTYYVVTLTDSNNCKSVDSVEVQIFQDGLLYVPNAFTPNGDGVNDLFGALGHDIDEFKLQIFDRWGLLVFESTNINEFWDGVYLGEPAVMDTYVWKVQYTLTLPIHGDFGNLIGHVTLIR